MPISAPENVVRAIAAAPKTQIRDILLAALGFDPDLKTLTTEQQNRGQEDLRTWFQSDKGEIPF
jgi:hypothetical protein